MSKGEAIYSVHARAVNHVTDLSNGFGTFSRHPVIFSLFPALWYKLNAQFQKFGGGRWTYSATPMT